MTRVREDPTRALSDPTTSFTEVKRLLQKLPDEVPAAVAAEAALRLRDGQAWWGFARSAGKLPERVLRVLLERLAEEARSPLTVFLLTAMQSSDDLERDWAMAIKGLLDLNSASAWSSKQRRKKIAGLAKSPLLPAIQAAAQAGPAPRLDLLAVLAADGSDASVDALLPHFDKAMARQSELLDTLERLETHAAKTEPMRLMFESVERALRERNRASPALEFARHLGFDGETFSVRWHLASLELNKGNVPLYQCDVVVDSTAPVWFRVDVVHVAGLLKRRSTTFGAAGAPTVDELGLGRCEPAELPAWFAKAARTLQVKWRVTVSHSTLRGAKRQRAAAWMEGA